MGDLLKRAYSAEGFKKDAHLIADMIAQQLAASQSGEEEKAIKYKVPEQELKIWEDDFNNKEQISLEKLAEKIFDNTLSFHNKGYMGHQVSVTMPVTALTAEIIAYLSHSTTVYELGMAGNAMEKVVINHMAEKYGYAAGATGVVTSGGSLGNLTALVTARTSSGIPEDEYGNLAIMTSVESHYSVSRAASIMGIKSDNIIFVPSDDDFRVRTDLLEPLYQEAVKAGKKVFCVIGCACTTAVGAYDDLEAIADFAEKHDIWFHVDGAHGAAAIFSEKYKGFLSGVERSDSIVVDFHKMMMVPALSTAVIYNAGKRKVNEKVPNAKYLWQDQRSLEWYNSAKHTMECTKPATIIHTYAIMRLYGDKIYEEYVDTLYDLGIEFGKMIEETSGMELAFKPCTNIVCFRYIPESGKDIDEVNRRIADELLKDGTFYIVNTTVRDKFCLRVSLMNPMTDKATLEKLIEKVIETGKSI